MIIGTNVIIKETNNTHKAFLVNPCILESMQPPIGPKNWIKNKYKILLPLGAENNTVTIPII